VEELLITARDLLTSIQDVLTAIGNGDVDHRHARREEMLGLAARIGEVLAYRPARVPLPSSADS
jgi:hypothetical protein